MRGNEWHRLPTCRNIGVQSRSTTVVLCYTFAHEPDNPKTFRWTVRQRGGCGMAFARIGAGFEFRTLSEIPH